MDEVNNRVGIGTSGPDRQLEIEETNTGPVAIGIQNVSNTSGAHALLDIETESSAGGDPYIHLRVSGGSEWAFGVDNTDSDALLWSLSDTVGTNNRLRLSTNGRLDLLNDDFYITRANSGGVVVSSVTNTSNTASSHARQTIAVGGTSAGDPSIHWSIPGTTNWSMGIDNSDSDKLKIDQDTSLGSNTVIEISTGTTDVLQGDIRARSANVAGTRKLQAFNSDNTSGSSHAIVELITGGTSGGDPALSMQINGVTPWSLGVDNSDGDTLKVDFGTSVGALTSMKFFQTGEVTQPLQPSFLAEQTNPTGSVTGAGEIHDVIFNSEIYDQGSDYSTATGTFTAPVGGRYFFTMQIRLNTTDVIHTTRRIDFVTSNRTYLALLNRPIIEDLCITLTTVADMDANDAASVRVRVSGSGTTVRVDGGALLTTFVGTLIN